MRRPQSAFGLVAVVSSLLVATLFVTPVSAAFAPAEPEAAPVFSASSKACTKWTNQFVPPRTIRVLRTAATDPPKKVLGTVEEVDFRDYVAVTMAAEWPEHYPRETLKAGAVATKQFAWFYILNPRGWTKKIDGERVCYDVVDSTVDQYYKPETRGIGQPNGPGPKIMDAIKATWDISLRKYKRSTASSRFFLTGYRNGDGKSACGEDANGWKLYHNSTRKCGEDGLQFREILRRYLSPNLEIVTPGRSHAIGTRHGDATALRKDSGRLYSHAWTPGRTPPEPGSNTDLSFSTDDLVGYASADMNGDGREDLVWLRQSGPRSGTIRVALSDGVDYAEAQEWWSGETLVSLGPARLLLGDFDANERVDVAILSKGESEGQSRLVVLRRKQYSHAEKLRAPIDWWTGVLDQDKIHSAWAGDISGDGRADLIIRQTPAPGGVRVKTALTKSPQPSTGNRMLPLKNRYESNAIGASKVKMIAADANRDGREDLLMLTGGSGPAKVHALLGQPRGGLYKVKLWSAPKSDPVTVKKTRLGATDLDYAGRTDLVLYSERANGKTRVRVLKTRYGSMIQGPNWKVGQKWSSIRPH